jgi:hypothetical protein
MKFDHEHCDKCEKVTPHYNGKCGPCETAAGNKARRLHFASLKGLTVEERLDRIEKWQYEMQISPPWIEPTY